MVFDLVCKMEGASLAFADAVLSTGNAQQFVDGDHRLPDDSVPA